MYLLVTFVCSNIFRKSLPETAEALLVSQSNLLGRIRLCENSVLDLSGNILS